MLIFDIKLYKRNVFMKVKRYTSFNKGSEQILTPTKMMSFPERKYQGRNSEQSSAPPYPPQIPHEQQHGHLQRQSYHGQIQNEQSFYAREPSAQSDRNVYVLPYPPPSYSEHPSQQFVAQPGHPTSNFSQPLATQSDCSRNSRQQYFAHTRQSYGVYAPPVNSDHQQYYFQPGLAQQQRSPGDRPQQPYPAQPGTSSQYPAQTGAPSQQYSSTGQQGQYAYYSPGAPHVIYVAQYPPPPPAAQDSPMARPGRRPDDSENPPEGWEGFTDKNVRRVFVRKVYIILMLQLLFTMGIIALFIFEPNVKRFVRSNMYLYWVSFAIFFGVYIGLICCQSVRRKYPTNFIVLLVFTLAMSYMLGTISSFHKTEAVLMAVGICAVVCLAVSIFSFYTKFDFTSCGGILCILLIILLLFGLIAIFLPSRTMTMIYAGLGAIVFTLFLAYDTQMLMGGKTVEISPEEYIFAAVQIYVDVVNIFLFLLLLIGKPE